VDFISSAGGVVWAVYAQGVGLRFRPLLPSFKPETAGPVDR